MRLRPTFHLDRPEPYADVAGRLRQRLNGAQFDAKWARTPGSHENGLRDERDHIIVCLHPPFRHFWSPWLHLEVQGDDAGTRIEGRFSPHPSVWSGFAFAYLALSVICFFSLVFASAQLLLGQVPWASGISLACVAIGAGLWWAAQLGQGLATAQMELLRAALDGALGGAGLVQDAPKAAPSALVPALLARG